MKNLIIAALLLFTFSAQAELVETFNKVEVNTKGSTESKVTATVYVVSELPFANFAAQMAARESIAMTLSSFKAKELVTYGAIDHVKYQILKELKQNERVSAVTISEVFITDLVVSSVGNAQVIPVKINNRKSN